MAIQDPMSIMAKASRLTITQLQQAIRNGTIPRDIGAIVLSQKIKEQQSAKQAQAMQQPQQPPVAQQAMAYQESPGVAALPSNLPTFAAANGGIVAFAGEDGSYVQDFSAPGLSEQDEAYARAIRGNVITGPVFDAVGSGIKGAFPVGQAGAAITDALGNSATYIWERGVVPDPDRPGKYTTRGELARRNASKIKPVDKFEEAMTSGRKQRQEYERKQVDTATPSLGKELSRQEKTAAFLAKEQPNEAQIMAGNAAAKLRAGDYPQPAPTSTALIGNDGGSSMAGGYRGSSKAGIPSLLKGYNVAKFDDSELRKMLADEMNPKTKQPYTYEEMAAQNRERAIAAGVDPDIYAKQMKELEGKKELSESRRKANEAASWFAMSRALADAKPGEGWATSLGRGLSTFGEKKGEISEKEEIRLENIRREANQLALAQNAYRQAELSGNKADMAAAKSQINAIRGKMSDMGVESTKAQNDYAKTMAELQNRRDIAAMQESGAWGRANLEKNQIKELANMYIKQANAQGIPITQAEAMEKAYYTAKFQGIGLGVDQREKAANIKAITDELKTLQYAVTPDQKQRKAMLQQQLNALQYGTSGAASNVVDFNSLPK